jgi:hypothetical protein
MLYDGGAGGPIGLFLLALAVAALIGLVPLAVAPGFRVALRDRVAGHILVALMYLPIVAVLIDEAGGTRRPGRAWGDFVYVLASIWLITLHTLVVVLARNRARARSGEIPPAGVRVANEQIPTRAAYEVAVAESDR